MLSLTGAVHIHLCVPPVDLRLGFDSLAGLVQSRLQHDPFGGHLFVFHNKAANRLKILYWECYGWCLWRKRLEQGRFHVPASDTVALELTLGQLHVLLDGIDLSRVRQFKRYQRPAAN
jgi:transposase